MCVSSLQLAGVTSETSEYICLACDDAERRFMCIMQDLPRDYRAPMKTFTRSATQATRDEVAATGTQPTITTYPRSSGRTKGTKAAPIEICTDDEDDDVAAAGPSSTAELRRSTRSTRHQTPGQLYAGLRALYPQGGGRNAVEVYAEDLNRLQPTEFLNDTVIDFYIRHIECNADKDKVARFHFFNSFFYKKLTERSSSGSSSNGPSSAADRSKKDHERVKKWTKGVDIFQKDFVFIPIHDALHWSLVVVCHPGEIIAAGVEVDDVTSKTPCILHLDSMDGGHETGSIVAAIRTYLTHEWKRKEDERGASDSIPRHWSQEHEGEDMVFDKNNMKHFKVKAVPKQDNHCDCGLFLLTYLEFFVYAAPEAINLNVLMKKDYG
eukprot:jgi/Chrzof1/9472/Cz04g04110.t1